MDRETLDFDVLIVGGGPAGLSAAIRLAQLSQDKKLNLNIALIEKAAAIGDHALSGAVLDPRALNELFPNWQSTNAPVQTCVTADKFYFLTESRSFSLPIPATIKNKGNYIISLSQLCRWLSEQAEMLGVNIFPGFSGTKLIYSAGKVAGVITDEKGLDKNNQPTARFQPGMELRAQQTFIAEGCRGSLTRELITTFQLDKHCEPQTYALGLKELWKIPHDQHKPGLVLHTVGFPLPHSVYGGGFVYHFGQDLLSLGLVVGLDYQNPYLNPYEEFQQFKQHKLIRGLLENGERLEYGARTLNEGGWQSIPQLTFPGGLLIGCAAGFINVPKIKGIHNAMKSGMVAAENYIAKKINASDAESYPELLHKTYVDTELKKVRNIRPAFRWGLIPGMIYAAIELYVFHGKTPWTFNHTADYKQLQPAKNFHPKLYPPHDHKISFDLMSSVFLSHTKHLENQPCHLKFTNPTAAFNENYIIYHSPETRYCPAGVFELRADLHLQINSANCIHCKACDIKDPTQNIVWTPPEGGSGPQYQQM